MINKGGGDTLSPQEFITKKTEGTGHIILNRNTMSQPQKPLAPQRDQTYLGARPRPWTSRITLADKKY